MQQAPEAMHRERNFVSQVWLQFQICSSSVGNEGHGPSFRKEIQELKRKSEADSHFVARRAWSGVNDLAVLKLDNDLAKPVEEPKLMVLCSCKIGFVDEGRHGIVLGVLRGQKELQCAKGGQDQRQTSKIQSKFLPQRRPPRQKSENLLPRSRGTSLWSQSRQVHTIRRLGHVASDISQQAMIRVASLDVNAGSKEALQESQQQRRGAPSASHHVSSRHCEVSPAKQVHVESTSFLELKAHGPSIDRSNASVMFGVLTSQELEEDLFQAIVEVKRQVHLDIFERHGIEDVVMECETPFCWRYRDEKVGKGAKLPADVLQPSLLLGPVESKLLHVCSDVVNGSTALLSDIHDGAQFFGKHEVLPKTV